MSGPKCYSVAVFDKQLKLIFQLQSDIYSLWETLNSKKRQFSELKIHTDLDDFISKNKKKYGQFSNPFSLSTGGTINQKQFDAFYNQIQRTIGQMSSFQNQVTDKISDAEKIESSYKDYLDLERYLDKLLTDFQYLKSDFIRYFAENQDDFEDAGKMISEVEKQAFNLEMPAFDQAFMASENNWKKTFDQKFENKKKQINQLVLTSLETKKKVATVKKSQHREAVGRATGTAEPNPEYNRLVKKIQEAIDSLGKISVADNFRQRFTKLVTDKSQAEGYFLSELLEEVTQYKVQAEIRESVCQISGLLQKTSFHDEQTEGVTNLSRKIKALLGHDRLKPYEADAIKNKYQQLVFERQKIENQKFAAKQERMFITARLISDLQELGYEVMNDMDVVDFEKDNSLLFRTRGQENFINLRFDQQGRLLYNFLIPENRDDLSHEKTQIKLAEMQQTCDEFNELLVKLKKQGLNIRIEKEIKASLKALIQLPARFLNLKPVANKKAARRSSQPRKRFLD